MDDWTKTGECECEICGEPLGYYAGSALDQCSDRKCGSCTGKEWANETIAIFEKALRVGSA